MKQLTKQTKKCEDFKKPSKKGHEHNLGVLQLQLIPPHISIAQHGGKTGPFFLARAEADYGITPIFGR